MPLLFGLTLRVVLPAEKSGLNWRASKNSFREQNKAPDFSWDILGQFSRRLIPIPIGVILLSVGLLYWSVSQPMIRISTEDDILAGNLATTETALAVILGA
jgi:hypothetical protein